MSRFWTCQRQSKGTKCGARNSARNKLCVACKKRRPPRKVPAHRRVLLEMPYEQWVDLFGEVCGICACDPSPTRRFDRDHDHKTGKARGLLCHRCNRALPSWMTPQWLRSAADYLERSAA